MVARAGILVLIAVDTAMTGHAGIEELAAYAVASAPLVPMLLLGGRPAERHHGVHRPCHSLRQHFGVAGHGGPTELLVATLLGVTLACGLFALRFCVVSRTLERSAA